MGLTTKKPKEAIRNPEKDLQVDSQAWDLPGGPDAAGGSATANSQPLDLSVTAICGASSSAFQLAGQTVGSARHMLASILNIEPGAAALVNGDEVDDTHVLSRQDRLEFVKKAGEKGQH